MPSMTAFLEFEAVARLLSFTRAADELGVTQAAVSKQIKALEEALGTPLFHRGHRSIALTETGTALSVAVADAMQRLASVYDRLTSGGVDQELVLATTAAFSHFRVLPRIAELARTHPDIKLRLITQMFTSDLRHNEVDLAIRYGNGRWQDGTSIRLFDEEVFPVCSPQWLANNHEPANLSELADLALIDYDTTSEGWLRWDDWFRRLGAPRSRLMYSLRCSLYTDAIQAALHSQGIVLGWGCLLQDELAAGKLIRLKVASLNVEESYFAVIPSGREKTPAVQALIDWIRGDAIASEHVLSMHNRK